MKKLTLGLVAAVNHLDLDDIHDIPEITKITVAARRVESKSLMDTLESIVKCGPLNDGDVPSKTARDALLEMELINKVVVKGEQGFQAANYFGWAVWKTLVELRGY